MGEHRPRGRVLIGKPGLDGHDRGAKVVARMLRDLGYEVIYTGLHQTPEAIVRAAIQEDVDVIGLSIMSGAHNHLVPEVLRLLREHNADDIIVCVGGIIPEDDVAFLKEQGVAEVFRPGTTMQDIDAAMQRMLDERRRRIEARSKSEDAGSTGTSSQEAPPEANREGEDGSAA